MLRIPDKIHAELVNWARFCHLGKLPHPMPREQCGSAEGDYRPPEWESEEHAEPPQQARIRPNERHAKKVQCAWEAMADFDTEGKLIRVWRCRLVLKAEYPNNGHADSRFDRANQLRMTVQEYEYELQKAVNRVEAAFALRA